MSRTVEEALSEANSENAVLRSLVKDMGKFCKWVNREGKNEPFSFNERQQKYQELSEILDNPLLREIMEAQGMSETMNDRDGDGSSHQVCPECGMCIPCGDCFCDMPGDTIEEKMAAAAKAGKWRIQE